MWFVQQLIAVFSLCLDVLAHYKKKLTHRDQIIPNLRESLRNAADFEQYEDIAERLDYELGNDLWKRNPQSRKYDYRLISQRINTLRQARADQDVDTLCYLLRSGLLRNLANISDKALFNRSYLGTKILIETYITEVMHCLVYVKSLPCSVMPLNQKLQFVKDTKHSYGLSALILQGGASFGLFHLGVASALWQQALLPSVISGTAIGALVAALLCIKTDEDLQTFNFEDGIDLGAFKRRGEMGQTRRKVMRFLRQGYLLDIKVLEELCLDNIGELTFEEAFLKSNRILNITIFNTSCKTGIPSLINYLTAPNVLIYSACLASNALPGLYEPVELLCKDEDGNIVPWAPYGGVRWKRATESETPFERISELFNVNNFIVSQARPYLTPFLSSPLHRHRKRGAMLKLFKVLGLEIQHRLGQAYMLGLVPRSLARFWSATMTPPGSEITIVPNTKISDFINLFKSPTKDDVAHWVRKGEQATWPAIGLIKVRRLIEITLSEIYEGLRVEEMLFEKEGLGKRDRDDVGFGSMSGQEKMKRRRSRTISGGKIGR